jgi:hypothetical protein
VSESIIQPLPSREANSVRTRRVTGRKRPLKPKDVWAIRIRLQLNGSKRDLALFDLATEVSALTGVRHT